MAAAALPVRLVLGGACGLLLLGGIAGAAIVDEDGGDAQATSAAAGAPAPDELTSSTAAPGAPGEVTTPAPAAAPGEATTATTGRTGTAATATGAGAGASTTTTARGRAGGATAPGPLVAPKPGAYVYEGTSTSSSGTRTDRATTTVEAAGTEGAATIQAVTIPLDLGGMQATARNTVAWSATGGAVVRRSVITVTSLGGQQLDCAWQPPFAQYAGGLTVGKTWSFTSSCAGKLGAIDVTIEQRATRKVTGSTAAAGPAGPDAVWTIADDTTVVITSPLGAGSVRTTGTQQLAPSLGLPVSTDMRVEARQAGQPPQQSTVKTKLVTLP